MLRTTNPLIAERGRMRMPELIVLVVLLTAIAAVFLIAGCGTPGEQIVMLPRQTHFGIQLPYPKQFPVFEVDSLAPRDGYLHIVPIEIDVDKDGKVTSVVAWHASDSEVVGEYRDYLSGIRFEPGVVDSVRSACRLPAIMRTIGHGSAVDVKLPLLRNRGISDADLYRLALHMNGVKFAGIAHFPHYFYHVDEEDTARAYDIAVFKMRLDSLGHLEDIRTVASTAPSATMILSSAAKWAGYTPLYVRDNAEPTEAYLAVALLRQIKYPTSPLPPGEDSLTGVNEFRVRLIPDTTGVMFKPVTIQPLSPYITSSLSDSLWVDKYTLEVRIDTAGLFRYGRLYPSHLDEHDSYSFRSKIRRLFQHVKFAPAMDSRGRPQPFTGYMSIACVDSVTTRLTLDWDIASLFSSDSLAHTSDH